jgi:hypothetical protein
MYIRNRKLVGKARRSHNRRRLHDPSLRALAPGGRILPNGDVRLTQIEGSTVDYQVAAVLGWRVTPAISARPVLGRIASAVKASVAEALAVAGLPANTWIDHMSIITTVREALGKQTSEAAVQRVAAAASYLAVERHLDIITAPIAAE